MRGIKFVLLVLALLVMAACLRVEMGRAFTSVIFRARASKTSTASVSSHFGSVLWSADMETGDLSQWSVPDVPGGPNAGGGVFNSGFATSRVDAVGFAHSGLHAATLLINTLNAGDLPTSGTRLFRWREPEKYPELYYNVWFYFPEHYVPNGHPPWWNVFQWKSKRPGANDPFMTLNVGNRSDGAMYFYLYDKSTNNSHGQSIKNIPEGQWFRVEAFYKCSATNNGHVTLWQDGVQILEVSSVQTRYADGNCEWSVNNYSASLTPNPAIIYVDDAAICLGGRCR